MKTVILALAIAGTLVSLSTPTLALQRSILRQYQGGIPQDAYNRCVQLAFARGQNLGNGDRRSFELFMDSCLRGRIPF